jgi:hypothetical protein
MSEPTQLPGRQCLCQGDGKTWVDTSACLVHDEHTSPLAVGVHAAWAEGLAYGRGWAAGEAHVLERVTERLNRLGVPASTSYDAAFDWVERAFAHTQNQARSCSPAPDPIEPNKTPEEGR